VLYADQNVASLKVKVASGVLPKEYGALSLEVREAIERPRQWTPVGAEGDEDNNIGSLTDYVPKAVWPTIVDFNTGTAKKLNISLVQRPYPNADKQRTAIEGVAILYKTKADGQPVRTGPQTLTTLNDQISFNLPEYFQEAYPQFEKGGALIGTISNKDDTLRGSFTLSSDGKAAKGRFDFGQVLSTAAYTNNNATIDLAFSSGGFSLPVTGGVTFTKPN
jgi:hypothetical protein